MTKTISQQLQKGSRETSSPGEERKEKLLPWLLFSSPQAAGTREGEILLLQHLDIKYIEEALKHGLLENFCHLTSLFLNAFTCCSPNIRYFGGMVALLPGILQQTRTEKLKLEAEIAAAGPRSCDR